MYQMSVFDKFTNYHFRNIRISVANLNYWQLEYFFSFQVVRVIYVVAYDVRDVIAQVFVVYGPIRVEDFFDLVFFCLLNKLEKRKHKWFTIIAESSSFQ